MQNKDKDDGIKDSPLDMLLVILLEGASKEVVFALGKGICIGEGVAIVDVQFFRRGLQ